MRKQAKLWIVCLIVLLLFSTMLYASGKKEAEPMEEAVKGPAIPKIPQKTVRIVQEPYYVCSAASIGIEKGWFKELGIVIEPPPHGTVVTGVDTVQYIASKKADMIDQPTVQVLGAIKDLPPIKTFVYDSVFYGYVILGHPGSDTVENHVSKGMSKLEALDAAMQQLKGKRFGYDGTAVSHTFLTAAMSKGNLTVDDIELSAFDDPEIVSMMLTKQIDFCGGFGFPAAQELLSKGFVLIASALDIVDTAEPSADSPELRTAFPVGWTTYDSFIEENYDFLLRFSSVVWRQARFINEQQAEAISIHLPFLNSISGSRNTPEQMKSAYELFDPFITFEDQEKWFTDPNYPLYYTHHLGAYINDWIEKGYLKPGDVKPEDISIADKIYNDAVKLKGESDVLIKNASSAINDANASGSADAQAVAQASELIERAKYFFENYNYLDAKRFAQAAVDWAEYSTQ